MNPFTENDPVKSALLNTTSPPELISPVISTLPFTLNSKLSEIFESFITTLLNVYIELLLEIAQGDISIKLSF